MNITEPLRRLALLTPDRPALAGQAGEILTYGALDEVLDLVGMEADRRGLTPRDAVGLDICGMDQVRALVIALGLARRGIATAASFAPGLTLQLLVQDQAPAPGPARVEPLDCFWDRVADGTRDIPRRPIHPDPGAVFRIFPSSETTGQPGYIAVDHRLMARRVHDAWTTLVPLSPVHVAAMPLSVPWGMTQALRTLWSGGLLVMTPMAALHDAVLHHGVTSIACVPGVLAEILAGMPEDAGPPPTLRQVEVGGGVLPAKLRQRAEARLCRTIINHFGSAEAGGIASAPLAAIGAVPGAVGYLHPGVRAEAVDETGQSLPSGTEGRLRLRTPALVAGYRHDPAATARHFQAGWFYTGDLGAVRADGLLIVTGGISEVIDAGGIKVAPGVIEQVLEERPEVTEAAVFGAPDANGITRVWAAVVAHGSLDPEALSDFLAHRLGERAPSCLMEVEAVPRSPNGNVLRYALTDMARQRTG